MADQCPSPHLKSYQDANDLDELTADGMPDEFLPDSASDWEADSDWENAAEKHRGFLRRMKRMITVDRKMIKRNMTRRMEGFQRRRKSLGERFDQRRRSVEKKAVEVQKTLKADVRR